MYTCCVSRGVAGLDRFGVSDLYVVFLVSDCFSDWLSSLDWF